MLLLPFFHFTLFFKLAKVKASSKQLNRSDRINRFGKNEPSNIIEGESEEVNDDHTDK